MQECYLMGDFIINLFSWDEMLLDKQYSEKYSQALPLVHKYRDLCFSHSFLQLIVKPTKNNKRTKTLIDHILANSPEKMIQVIHFNSNWNGVIWQWAHLLYKKSLTFKIKWTLRNIIKFNEKLLRWKFWERVKIK